jgi:predicted nucleic acid-binding protein
MKKKIYIDTSVIGGCFDKEFETWSNQLMEEFIKGEKIAIISDITIQELELAPEKVQKKLDEIPPDNIEFMLTDIEAESLAQLYISEGAITPKSYQDALHIANATLKVVHALISWNFKHIVNLDRIKKYNGVNLKNGYGMLEIRTPREILNPQDDE